MAFLDIHSHILPCVDDGARNIDISLKLLDILNQQGVTNVIATPHFYPDTDNAEDFAQRVEESYLQLKNAISGTDYPKVHLGCELHYFNGMGKSKSLEQFVIKGTNYILLELPYGVAITKTILQDITDIYEIQGFKPIIAHIERYKRAKNFKKLLELISNGYALAHINAGAIVCKEDSRFCQKLIKRGYISYVASDAHSLNRRPPLIKQALNTITDKLGKSFANKLTSNSIKLLNEIEGTDA